MNTNRREWLKTTSTVLAGLGFTPHLLATEKRKIHGGCHKPLMTDDEIKELMLGEGFVFKNVAVNPIPVKKMRNPYCLYRFVKQ